MPLYDDLEVRQPVRLEPTDQMDMKALALASAKAGALGGALGNVPRSMVSYEDWLRGVESDPLVFRGLSSAVDNPLAPRTGYAAFASNNPATALSYAGDPRIKNVFGDPSTGVGAAVHPIRLSPGGELGGLREHDRLTQSGSFPPGWFDAEARLTNPGQAVVVRNVHDSGPRSTGVGGRAAGFRQDSYAWAHPEGLASPASAPMSPDEVAGLMHRSAERAGLEGGRFSGDSGPGRTRGTAEWPEGESFTNEELKRVLEEVPNDPRFKPSTRAKAAQFLKGAAKEAFSLKNILTDAGIGSLVGAGSALAGYQSARPDSAGIFTPPGPGYEGLVTPEDIIAVAEQKEEKREARRVALLQEAIDLEGVEAVRELARERGVLRHQLRAEDLAQLLGPVR